MKKNNNISDSSYGKYFRLVDLRNAKEKELKYLELLKKLYNNKKIGTILLEAGGCLVREFLKAGLVDEWVGFYAPIIIGGGADGVAPGPFLEHEAHLEQPVVNIFGDDVCIRGDICYR